MSKSNLNGRSLEFFIINEILNSFKNINISNQLNDKLIIDKNNLIHLDERLYARFKTASKKIIPFIDNIIGKSSVINLERLSDIEGVKGDITDIRISYDKKILNLSLKHNHRAFKHQRPPSTPQQMGFNKHSPEDKWFREKYRFLMDSFLKKTKGELLFRNISSLIPQELYYPVCNHVNDFINKYGSNEYAANSYFSFLIGQKNFKKIIVNESNIEIFHFDQIPNSNKMSSVVEGESYIKVNFYNNYKLKMRLHTASSKITNTPSLKFDTQSDGEIPVKKTIIKL